MIEKIKWDASLVEVIEKVNELIEEANEINLELVDQTTHIVELDREIGVIGEAVFDSSGRADN